MKSKPHKSQLPTTRETAPLHPLPAPIVIPLERTRHTHVNIEIKPHLIIVALAWWIISVAAVL